MHKLPRTPLAVLVCPSAPFLAPRLLRTFVPIVPTSLPCLPSVGQRSLWSMSGGKEKTEKKGRGRYQNREAIARPNRDQREGGAWVIPDAAMWDKVRLLKELQTACEKRNVQRIMALYPTLRDVAALNRQDTRRIAQALHTRTRQGTHSADIFPFVQQFIADIRSGTLEPHPYAFVHLLGIHRDCKRFDEGNALWEWLAQREDGWVSQEAYGAAIELLAYGGLKALPELEELYTEALQRFPGTFAKYHLSPDAIVPDRTQPVLIPGIPTVLLQGIVTARMLARDWKRAYAALDTILRLYPTQTPPRFFELFLAERPISEAYTAFILACRAGTRMYPAQVTSLLTKLRASMRLSTSLSERVMILRSVANALYAYQESGCALESLHVGIFVHCFEDLLPATNPGENYHGVLAELRNTIVLTAHGILSGLIQAGFPVQVHPFGALMSVAGRLRVPDLLTTILDDTKTAKIDLGPIGTRSALTSAGLLMNKELVEQLWTSIVSKTSAEGAQIAFEDWITFAKACRRADLGDYFQKQLVTLSHTMTSNTEQHMVYQIGLTEPVIDMPSFEYMSVADLTAEMEGLKGQMKNVEAVIMSGRPLDLRQTPFYMHINPDTALLGSFEHLRAIYDEFTTDPHQPPAPQPFEGSPSKPITSSTGIPLAELRFMNWFTILEMTDEAEKYEAEVQAATNQALATATPLKGTEPVRLRSYNRTPIHHKDELRQRIRTLRNPNTIPQSVFRKIGSKVPADMFKPMDYQSDGDSWTRMKIRKFGARDKEPADAPKQRRPRLTHYVGMESHHEAPRKTTKHLKLDHVDAPSASRSDVSDGPDTY